MLKMLSKAISLAENGKREKDKEIEKTKKLLNRISKKDDSDNFFDSIIKGQIKQQLYSKDMIDIQIQKLNMMVDIIDAYECTAKEQEEDPMEQFRKPRFGDVPEWFRQQ
jgi:hypothetical protein